MNKKILFIVILLLSFISNIILCYAATDNVYFIDSIPMTILLSDTYHVIHRNMDKNDSNLNFFGFTYDKAMEFLEKSNSYFDVIVANNNILMEITLNINQNTSGFDFNDVNDLWLNILLDQLKAKYIEYGLTVSEEEIINTKNARYLKTFLYADNRKTYQFLTCYKEHMITIQAELYSDNNHEAYELIYNILDNNVFYGEEAKQHYDTETRVLYIEPTTGTSFLLPSGWVMNKQISSDNERTAFKQKNNSNKNIYFYAIDLLKNLSSDNLIKLLDSGITRKDYNLSYVNQGNINIKEYISSQYKTDINNIKLISYNGIDYYTLKTIDEYEILNYKRKTISCIFATVENGYLFVYLYSAPCDNNITDISDIDIPEMEDFMSGITYN